MAKLATVHANRHESLEPQRVPVDAAEVLARRRHDAVATHDSPAPQPAERLWLLVHEAMANRRVETLDGLEDLLV
jgi:hypothetical protein